MLILSNANAKRCHCCSKNSKIILMTNFEMTDRRKRRRRTRRRPKVVPRAAADFVRQLKKDENKPKETILSRSVLLT